ncbi:hypothetical protein CASFOL_019826 [Castilleja foliolosa]|uniref:mitogen-activated protein kinase kinase kinase n=1 Tax=Castilleja foliolosa TaxID=1961234 RepID=A0ABD3D0E9_9LAMI
MMSSKHKKQQHHHQRPRLDRRNALKYIDYDAGDSDLISPSSSPNYSSFEYRSVHDTKLFDLFPVTGRTSFRIEGTEGEVDQIFRHLGLGPEDFSIPVEDWEAVKCSSPSSNLKTAEFGDRSELSSGFVARVGVGDGGVNLDDIRVGVDGYSENEVECKLISNGGWGFKAISPAKLTSPPEIHMSALDNMSNLGEFRDVIGDRVKISNSEKKDGAELICSCDEVRIDEGNGTEAKRTTSSMLAPPPGMMRLVVVDDMSSTWDIFKGFGPQDDQDLKTPQVSSSHINNEVEENEDVEERCIGGVEDVNKDAVKKEMLVGLGSCSDRSNDEDEIASCSLVGENNYTISPNGSFRSKFKSWQKGDFLGSGSFGTVYEGFTDDGLFFAVKEVSLLDQGSQGQQSLYQLEQEISLLRQFQHENIVRYLGTDKDNAKLYIFLELVPKGSLARLYQKYQLRDSQVSVYTRQILSGLNYLHCRDVVHRDIKCANILVDVSGSVKLADFGLAKASKLNDIKSCKGTPFWMAPEVVRRTNHSGYGRAADIWSLGCTVLEMLTGQIPYSHLEGMQALFRIGRGELPPIPNTLSKDAQDFILKCLQVNPDDRPTAALLLEHPFVKKQTSTFPSPMSPHYAMRS